MSGFYRKFLAFQCENTPCGEIGRKNGGRELWYKKVDFM